MRNKLALTVDGGLWNAMADATSVAFADSYLCGARQFGKMLTPHTVTAYGRLKDSHAARTVLVAEELTLNKPLPFGHPGRADAMRMAAE